MNIVIAKNQEDIDRCLEIRKAVFVKEQSVPLELEADEYDFESADCTHFMIFDEDRLIGTYRIICEKKGEAHFQRFCILKDFRGEGYGRAALREAENFCIEKGYSKITLNSQCYAIGFYERSGFIVVSGAFNDAGIPHTAMEKNIEPEEIRKKKQLFLSQKELLDTFLLKGAISKAQYDKSYGDLVVKMGMVDVVSNTELEPEKNIN